MSEVKTVETRSGIRYRVGFLGAWALFVIALGLAALAVVAEVENVREAQRLARLQKIDRWIGKRYTGTIASLQGTASEQTSRIGKLRSNIQDATVDLDVPSATAQTILVSTAENKLWVRQGGQTVFEAVVSTGKGTTLEIQGRKMIFDTPTGRFHIKSKEENPVWVPPDWHYVEEARKKKLEVVRAKPGDVIDAETGAPVSSSGNGVWSLLGDEGRHPQRVYKVGKDSIVEVAADGSEKEVEPREFIRSGKALIVPPLGTKQRKLEKTLGHYRLNLGDGYALHGTQATSQLGRSVSHGCVRLGDADIEKLFQMSHVGDEVIIY
ncbi:MAG TPA: L,D-transpeptidase family protein [Thermoanaerobaculia bacterium]